MPFSVQKRTYNLSKGSVLNPGWAEIYYIEIYLDDILIFSKSKEEYDQRLKNTLERLYKTRSAINLENASSLNKKKISWKNFKQRWN